MRNPGVAILILTTYKFKSFHHTYAASLIRIYLYTGDIISKLDPSNKTLPWLRGSLSYEIKGSLLTSSIVRENILKSFSYRNDKSGYCKIE